MTVPIDLGYYRSDTLLREASRLLDGVDKCTSIDDARVRLQSQAARSAAQALTSSQPLRSYEQIRIRDCLAIMGNILGERADQRAEFSVTSALWDLARERARHDLSPAFYAELIHWIKGLEGRVRVDFTGGWRLDQKAQGRAAALARSDELDRLWSFVESKMARYRHGLEEQIRARRARRRAAILATLGASEADWQSWHWQLQHICTTREDLQRLVTVSDEEARAIDQALAARLPFAVTPHYASLMDDPTDGADRTLRAQVFPPLEYVTTMASHRHHREVSCDFMLEASTSPVNLVTRRYPAVVILKPFNTCPQICVYCQRNWEIEQAMAPGALATPSQLEAALTWIAEHPSIKEVLVTGGDPLAMEDEQLEQILSRLARIEHVDLIRIGTRTPVTMPMRITEQLASLLGSFRELGRREMALFTHVEHPYEITLDTARAVDRLRRAGLGVYNQQVFTFYVSRRFESALLRLLLRRIGIDPYYTFAPKGKEETNAYRVPLARIFQEIKEEARLVPGTRRTDEAVYNIPGLGKNYLRALQHRDLLSVLPNGARVYEFHPWEKNLSEHDVYLGIDVPILDYLVRLSSLGEDPSDYQSIWYYY